MFVRSNIHQSHQIEETHFQPPSRTRPRSDFVLISEIGRSYFRETLIRRLQLQNHRAQFRRSTLTISYVINTSCLSTLMVPAEIYDSPVCLL